MRKRRNPIERRRARRPVLWPWIVAGILGFVLTPVAAMTLVGDFDFVTEGPSGSWEFTGSYDSRESGGSSGEGNPFFLIWTVATWLPPLTGAVRRIKGLDVSRATMVGQGWHYLKGRAPGVEGRFHTFPVAVTRAPRLSNLAWGSIGTRAAACYTVWTSHKYRYSVEQLELAAVLPPVMLLPEGGYDKLMATLGGKDLNVESAAFNARWRVVTEDPAAAHAILHPRMMERLLGPGLEGMAICVDGGALLSWWPGLTPVPAALDRLHVLDELADLIPTAVYRQFGTPRDPAWGEPTVEAPVLTPEQVYAQQLRDQTFHP